MNTAVLVRRRRQLLTPARIVSRILILLVELELVLLAARGRRPHLLRP